MNEKKVLELIAPDRVWTAKKVIEAWNEIIKEHRTNCQLEAKVLPPGDIPVHYSEQTIREILEQSIWSLVYIPEFSIRDVSHIVGSDPEQEPYRYSSNRWWFASDPSHWSNQKAKPGYYLIRTVGLHSGIRWLEQEKKLNGAVVRMSSRLMIIAGISHFFLRGDYFEGSHWGPESYFRGSRCVSRVDPKKGFSLFNWGTEEPRDDLVVYVVRRFDS